MNSEHLERRVRARLDALTKPRGSLGRLEDIAVQFARIRGEEMPSSARKAIYVFCADHGVTAEGVSAYPAEVTRQMMINFVEQGAAISVLCRQIDARSVVVDVGVKGPPVNGVLDRKIAPGTRNMTMEPAMTREQAERAVQIGRDLAYQAAGLYDLVGLGEMGIGNTTAAAAILAVIAGVEPSRTVGYGAGGTAVTLGRKEAAIRRALFLHKPDSLDAIRLLATVGGFEIGAIAGFLIGASNLKLPVVLDGFPCCAGALIARSLKVAVLENTFFAHRSAEQGHGLMLETLGVSPLLDLGLRLGEGTGAALAMSLIDAAVRLYREVATFEEAHISLPASEAPGTLG